MEIKLTGRTDLNDYFSLSGIRETRRLSHHPFLIFIEDKNVVRVDIVDNAKELLTLPDTTKVMAQWGGKYSSDFFQFTVADFRKYIELNPKKDYHIV